MLKGLAIIAGGISLVIAVVLVARYDKMHNAGSEGYNIKCEQHSEPPFTAGTLVCEIDHGQNAQKGESNPPWWHEFFTWPDGITALLIMLTLGAIIWQAWETRKAAQATQLNAEALINSERPWLFLDYEILHRLAGEDSNDGFYCSVRTVNRGKTYAEIVSFCEPQIVLIPKGSRLPDAPEYGDVRERYPHVFLDAEKSADITNIDDDELSTLTKTAEEFRRLDSGEDVAYVFGIVFYRDLLKRDVLHELRWCLRIRPDTLRMHAYMSGPDAYNRVT